jgi:heme-degrading monooxygenase HmoA
MYTLLTTMDLGSGTQDLQEKLGQQFSSALRGLKGFKKLTMFRDPATGKCGGLSLWETKEDAEAALSSTGPKLKEALAGAVKEPPTREVYEVWGVFEPV